jgi:hypothetical protein
MPDRRPDLQRPPAEPRRGSDPLEQGLDRLVSAGRQLVDGVSGARPGARAGQRSPRPGARSGVTRPRIGELGRWVEDKLDWILEDEDDWREPWQEASPREPSPSRRASAPQRPLPADLPDRPPASASGPVAGGRRRPLEAISRRDQRRRPTQTSSASQSQGDDWPDDTTFARPRWQRPLIDPTRAPDLSGDAARAAAARQRDGSRPLPRSSRRRPG